jgi:hypothetical protein
MTVEKEVDERVECRESSVRANTEKEDTEEEIVCSLCLARCKRMPLAGRK